MKTKKDKSQKNNTTKVSSKIVETLKVYYERTGEASKIARQLAIMEGAIFWAIYFLITYNPDSAPDFMNNPPSICPLSNAR